MKWRNNRRSGGFSLIELLVVVAIILIVSGMAVPQLLTQMDIYRLRSATSAVAGVLQSARMQAIRDNKYYSIRGITAAATLGQANTPGVFVDSIIVGAPAANGSGDGQYNAGETAASVPNNTTFDLAGAHPAFPNALVGPNFVPAGVGTLPSFNSRGLPCLAAGAVCNGVAGGGGAMFAYFLQRNGVTGIHWSAITVTAAGRIKTWTWSGVAWGAN